MSDELTYGAYQDEIQSMARAIMEEEYEEDSTSFGALRRWVRSQGKAPKAVWKWGDVPDDRREKVWESVDGHQYVIYYAFHEEVLRHTANEPYGDEARELCKPDADWRDMRQVAVFLAMEADVHEELRRLEEEKEEAVPLAEVEA